MVVCFHSPHSKAYIPLWFSNKVGLAMTLLSWFSVFECVLLLTIMLYLTSDIELKVSMLQFSFIDMFSFFSVLAVCKGFLNPNVSILLERAILLLYLL